MVFCEEVSVSTVIHQTFTVTGVYACVTGQAQDREPCSDSKYRSFCRMVLRECISEVLIHIQEHRYRLCDALEVGQGKLRLML